MNFSRQNSLGNIQEQATMDMVQENEPYLTALYTNVIDPNTVTFENPPPNFDLKSEEILYLPVIEDTALEIAKLQCKIESLTRKQAEYELNLAQLILPANTPKATTHLFNNCTTDAERLTVVRIASSHLIQLPKIEIFKANITELTDLLDLCLVKFAATSGIRVINFPITYVKTLLNDAIKRCRIRFAHSERVNKQKQEAKEREKAKKTISTNPTSPPTIESLSKELSELKKLFESKSKKSSKSKPSTSKNTKKKPTGKRNKPSASSNSNGRSRVPKKDNPRPKSHGTVRKGIILPLNYLTTSRTRQRNNTPYSETSSALIPGQPTIVNKGFTKLTSDNLSKFNKILGYGLKYIPPPTEDISLSVILPLLNNMLNSVKWKYYFTFLTENTTPNLDYNPKLRLLSNPFSDRAMDEILRTRTNLMVKETSKILTNTKKTTFVSQYLFNDIKNLRKTLPSTKFISADKNLGLVAINTIDYHKLVIKHLSDEKTYLNMGKLEEIEVNLISNIVNTSYEKMLKLSNMLSLTIQEEKYVKDKRNLLPAFHVLAKIHKNPLSSRPIVGAVDWVTTRFSILLDIKLQKYLPRFPFILKDSNDLIQRWFHQPFDPNIDWLVSLDVTSLYTNIILNDAINIISKLDPILGDLSKLIMETNYFEYNFQLFHQKEGIAMGTNCAVAIANLYMATLIDSKLSNIPEIRSYSRFIDDICFIYRGTKEKLLNTIESSNSYHPKLKFTYVISKTELDVLDLTFYSKDNKLEHKTYQKEMNKYLYIPSFSNHPPATLRGFIKGELIRYSRSNSEFQNELAIRKLFYKRLIDRGYQKSYLNRLFNAPIIRASRTSLIDPSLDAIQILPYIKSTRTVNLKLFFKSTTILPYPIRRIVPVWSTTPSLAQLLLKSKLTIEQSNYLSSKGYF